MYYGVAQQGYVSRAKFNQNKMALLALGCAVGLPNITDL